MGFTGERAYKFKVDFINAFNQLKKLLKSKSLSVKDELKNARCQSDNLKNLNADLKDELICTQKELINFYKAHEKDKKIKEYKLDEEKIFQIQDLYSQGISVSKIAKVVGVSDSSVRKYARSFQ